jgi:hypothetical protein
LLPEPGWCDTSQLFSCAGLLIAGDEALSLLPDVAMSQRAMSDVGFAMPVPKGMFLVQYCTEVAVRPSVATWITVDSTKD